MTAARLAEIRDSGRDVTIGDIDELFGEIERLAAWLDVAAAAENANAKELRELRDLIALNGPVGAGNEADTLVEMRRLAFIDGLEAAATLCERRASECSEYVRGSFKTLEESALLDAAYGIRNSALLDAADAIRDIESKP